MRSPRRSICCSSAGPKPPLRASRTGSSQNFCDGVRRVRRARAVARGGPPSQKKNRGRAFNGEPSAQIECTRLVPVCCVQGRRLAHRNARLANVGVAQKLLHGPNFVAVHPGSIAMECCFVMPASVRADVARTSRHRSQWLLRTARGRKRPRPITSVPLPAVPHATPGARIISNGLSTHVSGALGRLYRGQPR